MSTPWRTGIVRAQDGAIWIRGRDIRSLMRECTFTDAIFLLHRGTLPGERERRLIDALLISVADHGANAPSCAAARLSASGNRQSVAANVAAGLLTIGDEHGGAGELCMEVIGHGLDLARTRSISIEEAAGEVVSGIRASGRRIPGLGHRVHRVADPRVEVLFAMARHGDREPDAVTFMRALQKTAAERIKPLPINIDGALAAVLHDLGFPPQAGKLLFIVGRVAGLTAEVAEEYAREKPMRIRIPLDYDGVPPIED
jgi:citrate synthase